MEYNDHGSSSSSLSIENDLPDNDQMYPKTRNMIRWKSGKKVDPRLLIILESFAEVYMDGHKIFGKVFHGNHKELFEKMGHAMNKTKKMKKSDSMRRSMSMGSIKERGFDDGIDGVKLERFKVKTPNVKEEPEVQGGTQTQPTQGSNSKK